MSDDTFTATFTRLAADIPDVVVHLDGSLTFQGFLDNIFGRVADHVPAHTYGIMWVFRDIESGVVIRHRRMELADIPPKTVRDDRRITDVGIRPGSTLEAILVADLGAA